MTENPLSSSSHVSVIEKLLTANEEVAADNRAELKIHGVKVINIMASPGAGKTTLLLATIEALGEAGPSIGVIEGDVASQVDCRQNRHHRRACSADQHRRRMPFGCPHDPARAPGAAP